MKENKDKTFVFVATLQAESGRHLFSLPTEEKKEVKEVKEDPQGASPPVEETKERKEVPTAEFGFNFEHQGVPVQLAWSILLDPVEGYTFAVCAGLLNVNFRHARSMSICKSRLGWRNLDPVARNHLRQLANGLWSAPELDKEPYKREVILGILTLAIKTHLMLLKRWDGSDTKRPPLSDPSLIRTQPPKLPVQEAQRTRDTCTQLKVFQLLSYTAAQNAMGKEDKKDTVVQDLRDSLKSQHDAKVHPHVIMDALIWKSPSDNQDMLQQYEQMSNFLMLRGSKSEIQTEFQKLRQSWKARGAAKPIVLRSLKQSPFYPYNTDQNEAYQEALGHVKKSLHLLSSLYPCLLVRTILGFNSDARKSSVDSLVTLVSDNGTAVQVGPCPDEVSMLLNPEVNRQKEADDIWTAPVKPLNSEKAQELRNIPFYKVWEKADEAKLPKPGKAYLGITDTDTEGKVWYKMYTDTEQANKNFWLTLAHDVDTLSSYSSDLYIQEPIVDGSRIGFVPSHQAYLNFPVKICRALGIKENKLVPIGSEFQNSSIDVWENVKEQRYVQSMAVLLLCDLVETHYGLQKEIPASEYWLYSASQLQIADVMAAEYFLKHSSPQNEQWLQQVKGYKDLEKVKTELTALGVKFQAFRSNLSGALDASKQMVNPEAQESKNLARQGRTKRTTKRPKTKKRAIPHRHRHIPVCQPFGTPGDGIVVLNRQGHTSGRTSEPTRSRTVHYMTRGVEPKVPHRPPYCGPPERDETSLSSSEEWVMTEVPERGGTKDPQDVGDHILVSEGEGSSTSTSVPLLMAKQALTPETLQSNISNRSPNWFQAGWDVALKQATGFAPSGNAFVKEWGSTLSSDGKLWSLSHTVRVSPKDVTLIPSWVTRIRRDKQPSSPKQGDTLSVLFRIPKTSLVFISQDSKGKSPVYLMHTLELGHPLASGIKNRAELQYLVLSDLAKTPDVDKARRQLLVDSDVQALLQSVGDLGEKGRLQAAKSSKKEARRGKSTATSTGGESTTSAEAYIHANFTHAWQAGNPEDVTILEETLFRRWAELNKNLVTNTNVAVAVCLYLFSLAMLYDSTYQTSKNKDKGAKPLHFL